MFFFKPFKDVTAYNKTLAYIRINNNHNNYIEYKRKKKEY